MAPTPKKSFHYHASASALGGVLDTPPNTVVPSQASVSLPQAGGYASQKGGAFNHEGILSCESSFTRVSGKLRTTSEGWTNQVASIVTGLNILQVVTIDHVVAQISVDHFNDGSPSHYSFAGSHFSGLRVHGKDVSLTMNSTLLGASLSGVHWKELVEVGKEQATALKSNPAASKTAVGNLKWMLPASKPEANGYVLCSLVDQVDGAAIGNSFGHYLEIPDVGTIFLAELVAYPQSAHLTMVRAELDAHVVGQTSVATAHSNSSTVPPH